MKRLLLSTLLGLTAVPALPAFADAKEAPRCERPQPRAERPGQRPDCPPPARDGRRGEGDRPAPREDRRAERGERPHDWRSGERYKGQGQRVHHHRADLPAPPRGAHWIRDGQRYLLLSDDGGVIQSVMARALR